MMVVGDCLAIFLISNIGAKNEFRKPHTGVVAATERAQRARLPLMAQQHDEVTAIAPPPQ